MLSKNASAMVKVAWPLALIAMMAVWTACSDDDPQFDPGTGGDGGSAGDGGTVSDGGFGAGGGDGGSGGALGPEICGNGMDDDGDGMVDCLDTDCATDLAACWTCDPLWYDEDPAMVDVICDCGCGLPDPDCSDEPPPMTLGCDPGLVCDDQGMCVAAGPESDCGDDVDNNGDGLIDCQDPSCLGMADCAPTTWTCDPTFYDEMVDVCDCNCGAPDPDCTQSPSAPVIGCMMGEVCDASGVCQMGTTENCSNGIDDDGDFAPDCADTDCLGEAGCPPVGWTCDPLDYDQTAPDEECHCECGVLDPDCNVAMVPNADCVAGETCNTGTLTCDLITGETCDNMTDDDSDGLIDCNDQECWPLPTCAPTGWLCNPALFDEPADTESCDCNCGLYDPDCDNMAAPVYGCQQGLICSSAGQCVVDVPDTWTCDPSFYGAADGCDCGCGAVDELDCADATAASCDFCDLPGSCSTQMGCPGDIDTNNNAICM